MIQFASRCLILAILAVCALPVRAQDATAAWAALSQPVFDAARSTSLNNVTLTRDRIRLTFTSGGMQFSQPVSGIVYGAVFNGKGVVSVEPPNHLEAQQLRLQTGKDKLEMEFTEAVLSFSDGTFDEISKAAQWSSAPADTAARAYQDRQRELENSGAENLPRLFKGLLAAERSRSSVFVAEIRTRDKGWLTLAVDALKPEEVTVGRWLDFGARSGGRRFETWMSFPAGNRSPVQAFRNPLAKDDYLIRSYRISAGVTAGAELTATTRVALEPRLPGERVLLFVLDANLRVESVRDEQGSALAFFQPGDPKDRFQSRGDYIAVVLAQPSVANQPLALEFRYAGKRVIRQVGSGNYFCQSFGWYPTRDNAFASRADFEMIFRAPKKFQLVATGNKMEETTDGEWTISTWKSDLPLAVAGFAFGEYKLHAEKAGEIDVEIYANRQPDDTFRAIQSIVDGDVPGGTGAGMPAMGNLSPAALAKTMATELANTLRVFEKYFGPYPYKRLAVTNIPFSYGQGWPTLIYLSALSFLDSTQRNALGIRDHVQLTDFFRAHESSHQWWGHRVGWKSYHDQWISEGFAQFSGNLYVQFRRDNKEFLNRLRADKQELLGRDLKNRTYESLGPIWMGTRLITQDAPGAYSVLVYSKGGFVLNMLRMMLSNPRSAEPDERFIAMMKDFCQTYHNQPASTEDFKLIVEKYMLPVMDIDGNKRLDWFFRQYVYSTGIPQYTFKYRAEPAADGKWKLTGTIAQSGVPEGWRDILPLYMHAGQRVGRIGWITVAERETPFEMLLPSKPEKLSLNYNEDILADIRQ